MTSYPSHTVRQRTSSIMHAIPEGILSLANICKAQAYASSVAASFECQLSVGKTNFVVNARTCLPHNVDRRRQTSILIGLKTYDPHSSFTAKGSTTLL